MEKSEKEKMLSGELYKPDTELINDHKRAKSLMYKFNNSKPNNNKYRIKILNKLFGSIGKEIYIEPPFYCDYGYNITVGENFYANFNCVILDVNKVTIGKNVLLAPNVQINSATHTTDPKPRLKGLELGLPITIGDNVWIGGGSIICPGVTIGSNTTIGAGSVVTKDIPANVVAVGNPCKVIKSV